MAVVPGDDLTYRNFWTPRAGMVSSFQGAITVAVPAFVFSSEGGCVTVGVAILVSSVVIEIAVIDSIPGLLE